MVTDYGQTVNPPPTTSLRDRVKGPRPPIPQPPDDEIDRAVAGLAGVAREHFWAVLAVRPDASYDEATPRHQLGALPQS
jgi:hypothetical protein